MVVSSAKLTSLITQSPVFTPFMSLPNKWENNFATRTQQNGGYPSLPGSLHENKRIMEETINIF